MPTPSNKKLNLPDSPRVRVFRTMVDILQIDPVLREIVKPELWKTWSGKTTDNQPWGKPSTPAVRLTPVGGPLDFWSADAMTGWLFIDLEVVVPGTCIDDLDNFYWCFQRALYPGDFPTKLALHQRLRSAGAHTGEPMFSAPLYDTSLAEQGIWEARGQIKIEVRDNFT